MRVKQDMSASAQVLLEYLGNKNRHEFIFEAFELAEELKTSVDEIHIDLNILFENHLVISLAYNPHPDQIWYSGALKTDC